MSEELSSFDIWLKSSVQEYLDEYLNQVMPSQDIAPDYLHEAMRYAVLNGGKRFRAALVFAVGQVLLKGEVDPTIEKALKHAASAVELVHAYSLVHDDMPCMDNDKLRRGKPTVHVQYDEATALLVGDALQVLAFEQLSTMPISPAYVLQALKIFTKACGSLGMAGGQAIDLLNVNKELSLKELKQMHRMKTGALIEASVMLGAIAVSASYEERNALEGYGAAIGLAFQVVDDILDVTSPTAELGKTAGKDALENKPTYVSVMGLEQAQAFSKELHKMAIQAVLPLGKGRERLVDLADFVIDRQY